MASAAPSAASAIARIAMGASEQAAGIGTVGVPPHAPSPALEDEPIADELEEDKFLMARSYFELKEFKRAGTR
eukprot:tig00021126_g18481.t1